MTLVCLVCVAVSVGCFLPSPPTARALRRLRRSREERAAPAALVRRSAAVMLAVIVVIGAALVAGPPGLVLALTALTVIATVTRLVQLHRLGRRARQAQDDVAHGCAALAAHVRVGRVPSEALATAARDWAVLRQPSKVQSIGGDVVAALRTQARVPGHNGLGDLARAWEISIRTGAPMAGVLEQVASTARADQAVQRTVAAELSGPRATGKVMAALPACGLAMGYLLGGDPIRFLLAGPLGWACLLGGTGLAAAGALWVDWLSRSVLDQD